jgi:ferredoxin
MANVDKERCIGCGACVAACEEGFELKDGKAEIKNANAPCLKQGAETCPVNAISA